MKKLLNIRLQYLFAAVLLLFISTASYSQEGGQFGKLLTVNDSLFGTGFINSPGYYKLYRATISNPHDTLTDSLTVYHVAPEYITSDLDTLLADTTQIRYKRLDGNAQGPQNDTCYSNIVVPAGESIDILIWYPFPDNLLFRLGNVIYDPERAAGIKLRGFNEQSK